MGLSDDVLLAFEPALLTPADAGGGLALSAAAGWNQTLRDWLLFIGHGHTVGCRDEAGRLVATAAALPYGGGLGWISMVLVAPEHRHHGLATRLMACCVTSLHSAGVQPVLDATPAGAQVYRRIGFVPGFELERWEGRGVPRAGGGEAVEAGCGQLPTIASLDAAATGLQRGFVLGAFLSRPSTHVWLARERDGFVIVRAGHRAAQLGPLVARDEAQALALLQTALASVDGPVFLDVPKRWSGLAAWLAAHGFSHQRPFVRMALGSVAPAAADRVFVLAGPEFG